MTPSGARTPARVLAAISELPQLWRKAINRWRAANRRHKGDIEGDLAPDANEEYLLYQTLLGTWPTGGIEPGYVERIQEYMTKAIKEAKVNSSWIQPNEEWDEAVRKFIAGILKPGARNRFLADFEAMAGRVAQLGMINSLTQTVLKCTAPGVPDIYQGTELWDFSLVDPDNRRPVDYSQREKMLGQLGDSPDAAELLEHWEDGLVKMHVTRRLLHFRRENPELFSAGEYFPLALAGAQPDCALAFRRSSPQGGKAVVLVPRLSSKIGFPPLGEAWGDTSVTWNASDAGSWKNILTGEKHELKGGPMAVADLLRTFPVAVLQKV